MRCTPPARTMPIRSPVPPVVRDALAERCGGSPTALASMLGISVRLARRVLAGKGVTDDERTLMAMNMRHAIRGTMQARLDTISRSRGGLERLMPRLRLCAEALDRMEAALGVGRETDVCPFPPWRGSWPRRLRFARRPPWRGSARASVRLPPDEGGRWRPGGAAKELMVSCRCSGGRPRRRMACNVNAVVPPGDGPLAALQSAKGDNT